MVKNRGIPETVILEVSKVPFARLGSHSSLTPIWDRQEMPFASRWGCYLLYYGLFRNEKLLNSIGIEEVWNLVLLSQWRFETDPPPHRN